MVQHFLQSGRSECSCRLTPFHPLSGKMTTRKKLVQLKNTSEEEQRNLVIFFFFYPLVWKHLEEFLHSKFGLF